MVEQDTISAIATPIGMGALAIVRISGRDSVNIAHQLFVPLREGGGRETFLANRAYFGRIVQRGELIDEVILTVFRAPKSYTCEDMVEISCHGGYAVAKRILTATLESGARIADPGEFTRRAFLNGRIDLSQAEA